MPASARKRPRRDVEENRADCPFTVTLETDVNKKSNKRRKRGDQPEPPKKVYQQLSPFAPVGKFKTHETLDLGYSVEPSAKWQEMTRYNSFVLNGAKYFSEGFIYVANDASIERQQDPTGKSNPKRRTEDEWVARILEIRASDEHHVYARVYWMYWPDELPAGTTDGRKYVQGRQPYHGAHELIASNHMDIINVVSVTAMAHVNHWVEENDDEIQNALYWRQAFDFRNLELSSVEPVCKCGQPEHPDKTLVGCSNESCGKWLHDDCLLHDALMRAYERLGKDTPYIPSGEAAKKVEEDSDGTKNPPLSPTETGVNETQQTIDVKADVQEKPDVTALPEEKVESSPTATAAEVAAKGDTPGKKKRNKVANGFTAREKAAKPYLGLFTGSLKMDSSPPEVEIVDLREDVKGGVKTWTEPLKCLICNTPIN
ncbi:hypothetical protein SAPIO_CDS0801 [Scedosporium apiospermum]|uniref:BAH domain-containing protein n=1 Tax=Pseudallescheria apiosperma TaxID=563466 RepID=A0A084GGK7_PSEDA|nr:uncharacterized protein SAPIO_CDS0801 [Scedosporium apiospermum]KEZ46469.1 hypothetical protein SAPIO_CDS0801 [Scedosporium apiospermum]